MVPAALMAFVVLRIMVGVAIDPTSHNLWPFEILMAGGLASVLVLALWLVRKLRSEEHTSELQSLMRISYAVFCLKKKKKVNILAQQQLIPHARLDRI